MSCDVIEVCLFWSLKKESLSWLIVVYEWQRVYIQEMIYDLSLSLFLSLTHSLTHTEVDHCIHSECRRSPARDSFFCDNEHDAHRYLAKQNGKYTD